jgi:hypothetical protein
MTTEKITWEQFRARVFSRIAELVEGSNCSNYTIMGYKYLDTKLVLHYADCDQVYEFRYNPIDEDHTNTDYNKQFSETSYYSKDYTWDEYREEVYHFEENYKRVQPEEK